MKPFRSVLVALDGSPASEGALRLAVRLVAPDGELVVAHAIDRVTVVAETTTGYGGDPTPVFEALEDDEKSLFAAAAERARVAGVRCACVSLDGPAAAEVALLAAERHVDAIAIGTHGRGALARMVLGSTASGVLSAAAAPAFVVGAEAAARLDGAFRSIVVAVDGSPGSRAAARLAVALAAADGARVLFAHVAATHDGAGIAQALEESRSVAASQGVACDAAVLHGATVAALQVSAETVHADLVALGTHARPHGFLGTGSVTAAIVAASRIPVLVVPPGR